MPPYQTITSPEEPDWLVREIIWEQFNLPYDNHR
jgi:hypothetical protein